MASSQQQMGSGVHVLPIRLFSHTATHMQDLPLRINPIFVAGILFPICAFATVKMNEFKLTDIKAGLGLSISRFEKLGRAGREEVEREGLATKTSATTSIWMILPRLCRKSYSWVGQETLRA